MKSQPQTYAQGSRADYNPSSARATFKVQQWHDQSAVVAGAGVAIGLALGTVASTLLQSQFDRMGAVEWTVPMPVTAVVMGLALAMTCLSAMPWLRVDPMEVVRPA